MGFLDGFRVKRKQRCVYSIGDIAEAVAPIAKKYGISKVYVFGSYARGEADSKSDVDLFIEYDVGESGIPLASFYVDVEEALCKSVDVVRMTPDKRFEDKIRENLVLIYER